MTAQISKNSYCPFFSLFFFFSFIFFLCPLSSLIAAPTALDVAALDPTESLLPYMEYLPDPGNTLTIRSFSSPGQKYLFHPLSSERFAKLTGSLWLRFSLSSASRFSGRQLRLDLGDGTPVGATLYEKIQADGIPQGSWVSHRAVDNSIFIFKCPGDATSSIYLHLPGPPGLWFSPTLSFAGPTATTSSSFLDKHIHTCVLLGLILISLLAFIRLFTRGGGWRLWTGLLAFLSLVTFCLPVSPMPNNTLTFLETGRTLCSGLCLLIYFHIGRLLLSPRAPSPLGDGLLRIFCIASAILAIYPFIPGQAWISRYYVLWPLLAILGLFPAIFYFPLLAAWEYGLASLILFSGALISIYGVLTISFSQIVGETAVYWGIICAGCILILPTTRKKTAKNLGHSRQQKNTLHVDATPALENESQSNGLELLPDISSLQPGDQIPDSPTRTSHEVSTELPLLTLANEHPDEHHGAAPATPSHFSEAEFIAVLEGGDFSHPAEYQASHEPDSLEDLPTGFAEGGPEDPVKDEKVSELTILREPLAESAETSALASDAAEMPASTPIPDKDPAILLPDLPLESVFPEADTDGTEEKEGVAAAEDEGTSPNQEDSSPLSQLSPISASSHAASFETAISGKESGEDTSSLSSLLSDTSDTVSNEETLHLQVDETDGSELASHGKRVAPILDSAGETGGLPDQLLALLKEIEAMQERCSDAARAQKLDEMHGLCQNLYTLSRGLSWDMKEETPRLTSGGPAGSPPVATADVSPLPSAPVAPVEEAAPPEGARDISLAPVGLMEKQEDSLIDKTPLSLSPLHKDEEREGSEELPETVAEIIEDEDDAESVKQMLASAVGVSLLIVTGDPGEEALVKGALKNYPFTLVSARNLDEAKARYRFTPTSFIFLNNAFPQNHLDNALRFFAEQDMEAQRPVSPVIASIGISDKPQDLYEKGIAEVIRKPYPGSAFRALLAQLIQSQSILERELIVTPGPSAPPPDDSPLLLQETGEGEDTLHVRGRTANELRQQEGEEAASYNRPQSSASDIQSIPEEEAGGQKKEMVGEGMDDEKSLELKIAPALTAALIQAQMGVARNSFADIKTACRQLAETAKSNGFREIQEIAVCVERAAEAKDREAIADLFPELSSIINRSFRLTKK